MVFIFVRVVLATSKHRLKSLTTALQFERTGVMKKADL